MRDGENQNNLQIAHFNIRRAVTRMQDFLEIMVMDRNLLILLMLSLSVSPLAGQAQELLPVPEEAVVSVSSFQNSPSTVTGSCAVCPSPVRYVTLQQQALETGRVRVYVTRAELAAMRATVDPATGVATVYHVTPAASAALQSQNGVIHAGGYGSLPGCQSCAPAGNRFGVPCATGYQHAYIPPSVAFGVPCVSAAPATGAWYTAPNCGAYTASAIAPAPVQMTAPVSYPQASVTVPSAVIYRRTMRSGYACQ